MAWMAKVQFCFIVPCPPTSNEIFLCVCVSFYAYSGEFQREQVPYFPDLTE